MSLMTIRKRVANAARALLNRKRVEADLDDEVRFHLEMEVANNLRSGMSQADARRAAQLAFGGVQRMKEDCRDVRDTRGSERWIQDFRYAFRRLRNDRGFSIPTILTLGLGLGAASAVFTLANAVLLRPLPYPDANQLVLVAHAAPHAGSIGGGQSEGTYLHYLRGNRVFDAFGVYFDRELSLTDGDRPDRVMAVLATPSLFGALRVSPERGRVCTTDDARPREEQPDGSAKVLISHSLWVTRYGADPSIIGRTISTNRLATTVIGVMPTDFHFPRVETQLWYCMPVDAAQPGSDAHMTGVARLKPGATRETATADLLRLNNTLAEAFPRAATELHRGGERRPILVPLKEALTRDVRSAILLLAFTAGFVLLIAWSNAANLTLIRSERQSRQIAVERALGATNADVARRLTSESLVLGAVSGAVALALASMAISLRFGFDPADVPRLVEARVDATAIGLAIGLSLLAATLLGGVSLARAIRGDPTAILRGSVGRVSTGRTWRRAQRGLAVLQVSLALALLIGSGAMAQSYWRLAHYKLGFDSAGTLTFDLSLPFRGYSSYERGARFYDDVLTRVRALPGVVAAEAAGARQPLRPLEAYAYEPVVAEGSPSGAASTASAAMSMVTPGWFAAMRIPVIAGRAFQRGDVVSAEHPLIVSAALARKLFPGENAVGKRFRFARMPKRPAYTVIGVVGDIPGDQIPDGASATVYMPVLRDLQNTPDASADIPYSPGELTVYVRAGVEPTSLVAPIRRIVAGVDPQVPMANVRLLSDVVAASTGRARLTMVLLLVGAGTALALGIIGVYGVVSYAVSQRTPELGVRIALGASPASVNRMVLREGAVIAAIGSVVGAIAALAGTRLLRGLLFEVNPTNPLLFAGMTLFVLAIAIVACGGPARRAGRIDPIRVLRAD